MGANVWPANAVTGSPSYQGRALRQTSVAPGLAGASTARPAGAFSGVRPGTSNAIVTATTTTWTVTPFGGVIDAEASNVAGPYGYFFDTNQSGSLTAAAGSTRLDRLDVVVSDPAEDGSGAVSIAIVKTDGVAGSGVTAAAPARSHPLAVISVPSAGSPTVIWAATYCVAAGGVLPVLTFALLPASAGQVGQKAEVFADSTAANNMIYRWNGSVWKPWDSDWITYTPTLTGVAIGTGGSATNTAAYRFVAGQVKVRGVITLGSSGSSVSGTIVVTLPVTALALRHPYQRYDGAATFYDLSAVQNYYSAPTANNASVTDINILSFYGTNGLRAGTGASTPFTWAAGDSISYDLTFDPA